LSSKKNGDEKMGGAKYEIWVDDFIRKVSLEELVQMAMAKGTKVARFIERQGKKMLINFFMDTSSTIAQDKTHVVKRAATGVLFTEVKEYKRMIVFNHFRGILSYTNDAENLKRYDTTYVIPVIQYPDDVVEAATETILKKGLVLSETKEARNLKTKKGGSETHSKNSG